MRFLKMRNFDYNGQTLAKIQGELFAEYPACEKCSPLIFIRRFMNSNLARRFDNLTVLSDADSIYTFVDELNEEYGVTKFGDPNLFPPEVLYWVGYLLRYWCFTYEISSRQLIKKINLKTIFQRYYIYHSMDPALAIENIIEEENIKIENEVDILSIIEEFRKEFDNK